MMEGIVIACGLMALALFVTGFFPDTSQLSRDEEAIQEMAERYSIHWLRDEEMTDVQGALLALDRGDTKEAHDLLNRVLR